MGGVQVGLAHHQIPPGQQPLGPVGVQPQQGGQGGGRRLLGEVADVKIGVQHPGPGQGSHPGAGVGQLVQA
ncbi:hypothetical protein SDC9_194526 [bioreactor metagenome]|uniref:Uncharacterized protein n=1 Tax=bioreactor metagenome TaxID=1076179 RepID=A0A645I6H0_9ZZZZ